MRWISGLFWNRTEKRLRAGWRVLLHLMLWVAIQLASTVVIGSPLTTVLSTIAPALAPMAGGLLFYLLNLLLVIGVTWLVARRIDYRRFSTLGLQLDRRWWHDLCFGLGLGALLMSLIFVTEWLLGWVVITGFGQTDLALTPFYLAIWQPIALFVVVGINEELLARGYQLRNLSEGLYRVTLGNRPIFGRNYCLNYRAAIVLAWLGSSALFGLLHIFNPNSTWRSTTVLMLAGIWLGLGYVLTGRLGISIGLHITWNFFQGNVYGFPVSGNMLSATTVIRTVQSGPLLWTGGEFGPEAGLIGICAILLGAGLTLLWVQWRYGMTRLDPALVDYQPYR